LRHGQSESVVAALGGLLEEFRRRRIVARRAEREGMDRHARLLTASWNERFPGFPTDDFPYTSFWGEHRRGKRDAHLIDVLVRLLARRDEAETIIVNPACVFGRHACRIAWRLPWARVFGSDIDTRWHRIYRLVRGSRLPPNYAFRQDDIFAPQLDVRPTAVVFFGACGSVSDGAIDYAIESGATYLLCRTCCHDNIGGNVTITPRFNQVNRFFRFKNWTYKRMKGIPRYAGYYFSPKYAASEYPRSAGGRQLSDTEEFLAVARDSPDSDICRAVIDLDRYLYLVERGFRVEYQGELFVAERFA